ncbi:MAG: DUF5058 family protein [Clostridia bacterium]|nr:DUF5058 family protein [Clostridia bacterium]
MFKFSLNSPVIYIMVAIVISVVIAQSVFFLVKAYKRGIELGMEKTVLNATIKRSALFTIAPAVAVFMGVVSLVNMLGVALPWLRLSIIGAVTYELPAAQQTMLTMGIDTITNAKQYVTVAFVMTFGIAASLILAPITCRKITSGMLKVKDKDKKWMDLLMTSMFVGMLAAFLGYIVCDIGLVFETVNNEKQLAFHYQLEYWIPVFVMAISAGLMAVCGILLKKFNWKWLNDYALPISMIGSMALAIPLSLIIKG